MKAAVIALALALLVAAPIQATRHLQQAPAPAPGTEEYASIPEFAASAEGFTVLQMALNATGLADSVSDPSVAVTLFAPNDLAFSLYLAAQNISMDELLDSDFLLPILSYHVVPAVVPLAEMEDDEQLPTMFSGQNLTLSSPTAGALFNVVAGESSAGIITADITAGQSLVHVVNEVLVPSAAALQQYGIELGEGDATEVQEIVATASRF